MKGFQKRTSSRPAVRNVLLVCGLLIAMVGPAVIANAAVGTAGRARLPWKSAGDHVFEIKADGPWTVDVEQPTSSNAPQTTSYSGDDDIATPFFWLTSGSKEVTITSPAGGELEISLLDEEGNEVAPVPSSEAAQAGGEPSASSIAYVPEDGIYVFDVRAESLWTVKISDAE